MAAPGAWFNYCGIGIIASCFRSYYKRANRLDEPEKVETPVILDTANMGKDCALQQGKLIVLPKLSSNRYVLPCWASTVLRNF